MIINTGGKQEVITLKEKQDILLDRFREGLSQWEIHRKYGIARKTIRSYEREYKAAREKLIKEGKDLDEEELIDEIIKEPEYDTSNRGPRKVTTEIQDQIKEYIAGNKKKRMRGQNKQQMKKKDMYEDLLEQGYDLSYSTVCNWVNRLKDESKETYIRRNHKPGDEVEFDWGYAKIFIDGELRKIPQAVFKAPASGYRYSILCPKTNTKNLIYAHVKFFEQIEGVFKTIVYDNLSTAVKRIVRGGENELTDEFIKLSQYYLFQGRFCNPGQGNEKGSVEREVEYVRRKAFSRQDHFDSLEAANNHLFETVEKLNRKKPSGANQTSKQLFKQEQEYLAESPPPYEYSYFERPKVDTYSLISIDNHKYSVPDDYTDKSVRARIYPNKIVVYYDREKIARHTRIYGDQKYKINIFHYLKTFKQKPGGLESSLALAQSDRQLKTIYEKHFTDRPKEFIRLLELVKDRDLTVTKLRSVIDELSAKGCLEINIELIKSHLSIERDDQNWKSYFQLPGNPIESNNLDYAFCNGMSGSKNKDIITSRIQALNKEINSNTWGKEVQNG